MLKKVIGLMSGTSMDGIDAAYMKTDGKRKVELGESITLPFNQNLRQKLTKVLSSNFELKALERQLTEAHFDAITHLKNKMITVGDDIDLIGFHGHTILHDPNNKRTLQIGDGKLLAELIGVDVICDFRSNDVLHGGQGAPFAPLYHKALAANLEKPLTILNLGGVANITWLGDMGKILAFDTGPGNALIDDFMSFRLGKKMDFGGNLAMSGKVDKKILENFLEHPYFSMSAPKSLDRNQFELSPVLKLSDADGVATLSAFTAAAIANSFKLVPKKPKILLVTGGGRHNLAIMRELKNRLGVEVQPVENVGWNGDALEAQAFGYLAVRSLMGLSLSLPSTTGVDLPLSGGVLFRAS
jgi:anhydro-N-acetylmuramic acid kinase